MNLPQDTQKSVPRLRVWVMAAVVVLAFTVVLGRLYGLQVRQGKDFEALSRNNFFQFKRLEHERGEVVDRQGRLLVTNRPSVNVYVTPAFFPSARLLLARLGRQVGLDKQETDGLSEALGRAAEARGPALLFARDLTQEQALLLRETATLLELPLEAIPILAMPEAETYAAYLDPQHFPSTAQVLMRLGSVLEMTKEELDALSRRVRRTTGLNRYVEILVRRDLPPRMEGKLSLLVALGDVPGVALRRATARYYPHRDLAAHVIGYVNELTPEELEKRRDQGYRLGDAIGRRGVEQAFEEDLRGTDGRETVVVDSKGRSPSTTLADELVREIGSLEPPRSGNRVVLTLDLDIQRAAEAAFENEAGSVVMLEVDTGRILALTSTPSFDPNKVAGFFDPAERRRLAALDERRPWRFRGIQDYFAPGSTFKVVTALAAMEKGAFREHEHVNCPGAFRLGATRFRCWKDSGHGPVDLEDSLAKSCDVFYYTLGARMGLDPIADMGFRLGFGKRSGVPLRPESAGIMPDEAWYERNLPEGYTLGAAVNASIGQGAVSVTPIQLAVAYAAIGNGGTVFEPQIALRVEAYDQSAVREVAPKVRRKLELPPEAFLRVREGLRQVVNEPFGTAYKKRLENVAVAGKTGTAQVAKLGAKRIKAAELPWKLRDHAWFAAVAPAEAPKVAIAVLVEHGGGGSSVAAPIAMKVIDAWHKKQALASLGSSITVAFATEDEAEVEWPAE